MTYWIVSLALIVFGYLGGFSIGLPFRIIGLAMLLLGPLRHHPRAYWPPMSAVLAFFVGYAAVAPISCTATQRVGGLSRTVCASLVGIRYEGTETYNAPLMPGLVAGLLLGGAAAIAVAIVLWRRAT
jgi:hypothetical protein